MDHHTVDRNPEEYSLLEILTGRYDTMFLGRQYDSEEHVPSYEPVIQDEHGNWFLNPHDHIGIEPAPFDADDAYAGILVADTDHKHCDVEHPETDLPHLIGLYVRESYRGQGIATELIHDFIDSTSYDTCVVHADSSLEPFYDNLDCDVVYL